MRIGTLRTLVTIYEMVAGAPSSTGAPTKAASAVGKAWAAVMPIKGAELAQLGIADAEMNYRVVMRWQDAIRVTPQHHFTFSDAGTTRTLNILSAANVNNANRTMEFACKEDETRA